jgi:membrane protein YqaA with SNARE-associated domain
MKERVDRIRHKIEKWAKAPKLILFASGLLGFPPLYLIGFIAHPMLGITIVPFTVIVFCTRIVRFFVIAAAPLVL